MHLWVRAEQRANERRVGITPEGVKTLLDEGFRVTVEDSPSRVVPTDLYERAGCEIAAEAGWPGAPSDAIIFGLKELPDDDTDLIHRHIMFGHAYKGQFSGRELLRRFRRGGGTLYDLEYLVDEDGRRVAAFGYWAGYMGAAVSVQCWLAQQRETVCASVTCDRTQAEWIDGLTREAEVVGRRPSAIVIGAAGRVGAGAADLCDALDVPVTKWDLAETAHGGPFPEILEHDIFLNCVLARPQTPVFVPRAAIGAERKLTVIGDVACDPDSDYNPVPLYDRATSWSEPAIRVGHEPPLDVMAIDNLPSLLPRESAEEFAGQLLPHLRTLTEIDTGVWGRAREEFRKHLAALES